MKNEINDQKVEYEPFPEGLWVSRNDDEVEVGSSHTDKLKVAYHIFILFIFVAASRFLSPQTPWIVWVAYGITAGFAAWALAENLFSKTVITIGKKTVKFTTGFGFFTKTEELSREFIRSITLNTLVESKLKQLVIRSIKLKPLRFGEALSNRAKNYIRAVISKELAKVHMKGL